MEQDISVLVEKAKHASEMLKQLSHESRLLMLCFISDKEKSVQEIEKFLGTSQSNTSQHLAKLRSTGLIKTNKIGNQVFYSINNPDVLKVIKALQEIYCS